MYASVSHSTVTQKSMNQTDIEYIIEILNDAIAEKDWDKVEEAREVLKEFLDTNEPIDDD